MTASLKFYQGLGYDQINSFIRDPGFNNKLLKDHKSDETVDHINNIDVMMEYNDLKGKIFYRGIADPLIPMSIKYGSNVLVNRAYTSSTTDLDIIKSYVNQDGCCILKFLIPANIQTYIYRYSGAYTEKEVLIQRDTQFVINLELSTHPIYYAELRSYHPPIILKPSIEEINKKNREEYIKNLMEDEDEFATSSDEDK